MNNINIKDIPDTINILPLRNAVAFPFSVMPLVIAIPRSIKLIEEVIKGDRILGLLASKDPSLEEPPPDKIYTTGTVARISYVVQAPDDTYHVVAHGLFRFRILQWLDTNIYLSAKISLAPEIVEEDMEMEALQRSLKELAQEIMALSPNMSIPEQMKTFLLKIRDPRYLAYVVAANIPLQIADGQKILEMDAIKDKLHALISYLSREKDVLSLGKKIRIEAHEEINKAQREFYLRQQLKTIQKELGEADEGGAIVADYMKKMEEAGLAEEARIEFQRELERLKTMSPQFAEYTVIKSYLDWLVALPWNMRSEDNLEIEHARLILDEDHYNLQEVKDRIIEFLAVRKIIKERGVEKKVEGDSVMSEARGAILCFVGPPGVGKTSLGQSIARALGRKFTRMSLGGMRDEAEIRGHRRTYVGAMPGRIIQALKRSGTRNPVFMLDEVDKLGKDWHGDPTSALLEVLDPAQNNSFRDHYLDVDFDLSDVMFITTANQLEPIPDPLRDRMEIIQLDGYTEFEKMRIAQDFLVPRQIRVNGLISQEIAFENDALLKIIRDYTREAGVRNLERQLGSLCRKCVVKIAAHEQEHMVINTDAVRLYLKKEKFESESSESIEIPGIAIGLAVTYSGGDILFIEATSMKGDGKLSITGQLGDVMRESAQIAYAYIRAQSNRIGIDSSKLTKTDLHIHVPAGAVSKDGPSAGIAMVVAMASLFTGRAVRGDVGMTGEITLRGRVLPVGGIKMKVLAAHRAGLSTIILPKRNEHDLEEIPEEVRSCLQFKAIDKIEQALEIALK
ncbi:MAG: endopeptidase La [bacterium]